uniref:S-acyltransferase n=1 Tax=Oryza nivara TaxID=4536 RepID=A0A0E0HF08_ORYNI
MRGPYPCIPALDLDATVGFSSAPAPCPKLRLAGAPTSLTASEGRESPAAAVLAAAWLCRRWLGRRRAAWLCRRWLGRRRGGGGEEGVGGGAACFAARVAPGGGATERMQILSISKMEKRRQTGHKVKVFIPDMSREKGTRCTPHLTLKGNASTQLFFLGLASPRLASAHLPSHSIPPPLLRISLSACARRFLRALTTRFGGRSEMGQWH